MKNDKCSDCEIKRICASTKTAWAFFFLGMVATIAMRVIEPLRTIDPLYAKVSWYIGVGGFFLFFVYKYRELTAKSKLIRKNNLLEKLVKEDNLSKQDLGVLAGIVCSQDNSKERTNFLVIFISSAIVLLIALYFDFLA